MCTKILIHTKVIITTVSFEFLGKFLRNKYHKNTLCKTFDDLKKTFMFAEFNFLKTTPMQTVLDAKIKPQSFKLVFFTCGSSFYCIHLIFFYFLNCNLNMRKNLNLLYLIFWKFLDHLKTEACAMSVLNYIYQINYLKL